MTESNPYAPPQAELIDAPEAVASVLELADRGTRLAASIVDGIILVIPIGLLAWGAYAAFGWEAWAPRSGLEGLANGLGTSALASLLYLAINGHLLAQHGQSVGKRLCRIRIVKKDGSLPTLWDSFVMRQVAMTFAQDLPVVGSVLPLIDVLMIFRKSRRCFHDELAGTLVVKTR